MPDRLSALDASFLFAEDGATSSMHVGALAVFVEPEGGIDFDALERYVGARLVAVPRFRQRVRTVPGGIARPVWVDDDDFDLTHHIRRSVLPKPGSDEQLDDFVARVMARPLDRDRPLWELYVVQGLRGGRFAVVTKTHHALVDGVAAVDVMQVLLDPEPHTEVVEPEPWEPKPAPSDAELVAEAVSDMLKAPSQFVDAVARTTGDITGVVKSTVGVLAGLASTVRAVAPPPSASALVSATPSTRRVFRGVSTSLEQHKAIRAAHGTTVNDVVLAVVAGALRGWLMSRGEPLSASNTVRALVPVSLRGHMASATEGADAAGDPRTGNVVSAYFIELPVGEASPIVRLQQIAMDMRGLKDTGQALGAKTVIGAVGYAPTTMHSMAARAVNALSDRMFGLAVTNIPGPQFPLYVMGARLVTVYPVAPIAHRQAVAIAVASYDGQVNYGLIGDGDAMADLDVLAACLEDSLIDLVAASKPRRRTARGGSA
jgi:diacylglycerol O-acyltransferase / wax synthase